MALGGMAYWSANDLEPIPANEYRSRDRLLTWRESKSYAYSCKKGNLAPLNTHTLPTSSKYSALQQRFHQLQRRRARPWRSRLHVGQFDFRLARGDLAAHGLQVEFRVARAGKDLALLFQHVVVDLLGQDLDLGVV